jgi:chromosome segregation ATPase
LREVKEEVGELKKVSENHETSIKSNADEIKKLKSLQEKNEKSLENLKKSEEKQDKRIDDLENLTNSHGSTLSQQHSVIDHHSSEIETIKKLISALNPSAGVSVDLLSEIQAQIRSVDEKHSKVEDKFKSNN